LFGLRLMSLTSSGYLQFMVDPDRLSAAFETARCDLLAESATAGRWTGQVSSSAFSTSAATSALAIVKRQATPLSARTEDENQPCRLTGLIMGSLRWLARRQNPDGGWGDVEQGPSSLATTMLVRSAFALTCVPASRPDILERADAFVAKAGGARSLARMFGRDRSFLAPMLTQCALAGLVRWNRVPAIAFEWTRPPNENWPLRPHVALPPSAVVAIGYTHYFHRKPWNPVTQLLRGLTAAKRLKTIAAVDPATGGLLQSTALTSFVVMSLASSRQADHPLVAKGVDYLLNCVRPDGSWPLTVNLATRRTAQAVVALSAGGEDLGEVGPINWLLARQMCEVQAPGEAQIGGWTWSDLAGGTATVEDTSAAMLALAVWPRRETVDKSRLQAAASAADWLLAKQNRDGGWPCDSRVPPSASFISSAGTTAQAIRALAACRKRLASDFDPPLILSDAAAGRIGAAIERGVAFLDQRQNADGRWSDTPTGPSPTADEDPIVATTSVLSAYRELDRKDKGAVRRALGWLLSAKRPDGSWATVVCAGGSPSTATLDNPRDVQACGSVEATALASEALLTSGDTPAHELAAHAGIEWLVAAVEANRHQENSPAGLQVDRINCYDKLRPLITTVAVLGHAASRMLRQPEPRSIVHTVKS
jgi:squalene-hopene/tetraprenyl-beta-curcumene cyclase